MGCAPEPRRTPSLGERRTRDRHGGAGPPSARCACADTRPSQIGQGMRAVRGQSTLAPHTAPSLGSTCRHARTLRAPQGLQAT